MEVIEVFLRKQAMVKKWADGILGYELSSDDLWEQLKSGVDLCRLMLKIKEGYVFSGPTCRWKGTVAMQPCVAMCPSICTHFLTRLSLAFGPRLHARSSIPTLNENPKIQFVKKENIMFFIEAAKEYVAKEAQNRLNLQLCIPPVPNELYSRIFALLKILGR